jgi:hypothetical protein
MSKTLPTSDMSKKPSSTRVDYSVIKRVLISFTNVSLNDCAADIAPDFDDFFDESNEILDPDLLAITCGQVESVLSLCEGDKTRLPSLVDKIFFKYFSADAGTSVRLRTQTSFEGAFQEAARRNESQVNIVAYTNNLHFHPDFQGNNLDLLFTTYEAMSNLKPKTPFLGTVPSSTVSSSVLPGKSAAITQPTPVPTNEFRHHLLPSDVKKRYDDHQDPNIIVPIRDLVPFQPTPARSLSCKYFHQADIAGDKVIVLNGAVLASVYDSKKFHKTVPFCNDISFHGLRSWYKLFSGHGNACGLYIVPYELLSHGHGGGQGFLFDEDLPPHKSGYGFDWQNDILRALQHPSMFPSDSIPAQRMKGRTNGYYGIIAILHDSHPAFVSQPVALCKNWPEQKPGQSIFDFHAEFTAAIALRAIYMDGAQDLNSPTMMSTFMQNCTHSAYLLSAARLDALDPSTSHQMSPGNLAITLSNYLSRADSPSQFSTAPRPPPRAPSSSRFGEGSSSNFRGGGRSFPRRINALGDESDLDYDAQFEAGLDEAMPSWIHQLARDGPVKRHCMFCGEGHVHLFDACPILNDKRFLNSFAIRVGSAYERTLKDASARQKEARGVGNPAARIHQLLGITSTPPALDIPPASARLHQVLGITAPPPAPAPLHPDFLSPDFVPGQPPPDF